MYSSAAGSRQQTPTQTATRNATVGRTASRPRERLGPSWVDAQLTQPLEVQTQCPKHPTQIYNRLKQPHRAAPRRSLPRSPARPTGALASGQARRRGGTTHRRCEAGGAGEKRDANYMVLVHNTYIRCENGYSVIRNP